jgi:hypothetical protein
MNTEHQIKSYYLRLVYKFDTSESDDRMYWNHSSTSQLCGFQQLEFILSALQADKISKQLEFFAHNRHFYHYDDDKNMTLASFFKYVTKRPNNSHPEYIKYTEIITYENTYSCQTETFIDFDEIDFEDKLQHDFYLQEIELSSLVALVIR